MLCSIYKTSFLFLILSYLGFALLYITNNQVIIDFVEIQFHLIENVECH